jgi:BirA family biotin operon repressor/biotin-[acetyl-CoA-carboxylase] ligase
MKTRILQILKEESTVISGEELSRRLGVTRVTIWKHIRTLQDLGYTIQSGPKGYFLSGENDFLYPWEFKARSSRIHYHEIVASTMDTARELARQGAENQSVVIAGIQRQGRGRMRRPWFSREGGLYFTLILRPSLPAASGFLMNFVTSVALVESIRELTGLDARVKWPNDILINDSKLSGMLSEMEAEGDMVTFVNIGIGINVNNEPEKDESSATSIAANLGHEVSRRALLSLFLDKLERRMQAPDFENCVQEWKKYTMTLGRRVKIVTLKGTNQGLARDVDDSGALILERDDGAIEKIMYGDCFHI